MAASVRFVTFSDLRMAVTWFLTVGSAKFNTRQIALLLFPCIKTARTSRCRAVKFMQTELTAALACAGRGFEMSEGLRVVEERAAMIRFGVSMVEALSCHSVTGGLLYSITLPFFYLKVIWLTHSKYFRLR
jgi:hypothetical protein